MQKTKTNKLKELLNKLISDSNQQNPEENVPIKQSALPPIKTYPKLGHYPLTSAQKRLFILHELALDKTIYNIPLAVKITGKLDVKKVQDCLRIIIQRHDALRSCFELVDGSPVQIIHEKIDWQLELVVERVSKNEANVDSFKILKNWIKPFDLRICPLFQIKCIQAPNDIFFLFIDMHHIIGDARSFTILIEEFSALYSDADLEPLKFNYKDYALWQNELLISEYLLGQKNYWVNEFSHPLPILQIPFDDSPLSTRLSEGDRRFFVLNNATTNALRSLAREMKVSLYMLILSIYTILLYRHTNEEEIIIGSSVEGRPYPEWKELMGVFINALSIKSHPHASKTFDALLREIKKTCVDAYENQLFPFEELANAVIAQRELNTNPIFQTLFDFHKASRSKINLKGLSIETIVVKQNTAKFPISLEAIEHDDHLELFFEYATPLYAPSTIERLIDSFANITEEIISNPRIRIGEISVFNHQSYPETLSLFNHPDPKIPCNQSFQSLFKKQASIFADKIAAEDDHHQITYRELDEISTHLSSQLRMNGVQPGDLIATRMERSLNLLISMLAIFKAGAAYLPIDPEYPLLRAQSILNNSSARLLLVDNSPYAMEESLTFICDLQTLLSSPILVLPDLDIPAESPAYIIFTSGSTGNPKGAILSHNGMINHIYSKIHFLRLSEDDVIAQTSSQTFDVSIWQFLTSLLAGGKVVVFNNENAWSPSFLLKELEKNNISIFETVPSHMHLVLDAIENEKTGLKALRFLILNGEVLPTKICDKWHGYYPQIPIVNAYGPTECSDDVCHHLVNPNDLRGKEAVPIGRMIPNIEGYILNESLSFMPPNIPGEFYIGGIGLGKGYIGQPDLTAEVFIPSPFGQKGERLYRTKDLVRYTPQGSIEYLGRVDRQVKIQGVRIELEEIENALKQHPLIQQAVVLLKKSISSNEYLAAYLISEKKQEASEAFISEIRTYLKQKVPPAMIPNIFIFLESFPLNPSGKINTKALPEPIHSLDMRREFILPETPIEEQIASLWKMLLKIIPIGKKDHFFEKGGNSLLAIQYTTQIRQIFGIEMPLHEVFSHPLLEDHALYIDNALKNSSYTTEKFNYFLPTIPPDLGARYEPFPLTDIQHAYWLGRSGIFELGNVSVHIYTEYEKVNLNLDRLEEALNLLIDRHEMLRVVIPGDGTQTILKQTPHYHIKRTDLSGASAEEIADGLDKKRQSLSHEVFAADAWPLFSVGATLLPENKVRLHLSFDALVFDGWSVNNLMQEWKKLYDDMESKLSSLELSFRDYVLTINKIKETAVYQRDRQYWLARLEGFPLAPRLPLIKATTSVDKQQFARCNYHLSEETWKKCKGKLKAFGLSPTAFVTAIFSELLAMYSGSHHFALNLTLFDRLPLHPQINDIVGDFTSIVLLEVDRRSVLNESFLNRAMKLQKQLWQDLDHHLYSGIDFLRELSKQYKELPLGSLMPVVLTSILGLEDTGYNVEQFLGKEIFGISQTPQLWLDYKAYEMDGDLVVEWDYVKELFAPDFIPSMHASYCHLLNLLAADSILGTNPWEQVSFPLISEQEKKRRDTYNDTSWPASYTMLHDIINDTAERLLAHPAVISKEGILTYKDLCQKANQVGHLLSSKGIQANQLIAVIMEKGWEQVIACLGILNAGAAYLPIDSEAPSARIEELLHIGEISMEFRKRSIDQASSYPTTRLNSQIEWDDLAYVIFTSGSTGKPKGVMIEQKAIVNTILDINERHGIQSSDRVLSLSNLNFDLSVYDIFGLLAAGGTIVFPDPDKTKDPSHWIDLILEHQVTVWNSVPMFMLILIEFLENASPEMLGRLSQTLRLVILSGDWIPTDLPKKIYHFFGQARPNLKIVSMGGATEASIWSIAYDINPLSLYQKSIPYGFPLRNQTFHVLNDRLEPTPEETIGELYIGGVGLARGYWRDPQKTDQVFLKHPQLGRIYKTGDLGCFHKDTGIEFLGREDFQVKIGGHRIELGEIESVLNTHRHVQQTVLQVAEDRTHTKRLVAWVVPKKYDIDFSETDLDFPIIQTPQERAAFTLAQHGRRRFSDSLASKAITTLSEKCEYPYFDRKSYRRFDRKPLEKELFIQWVRESFKKKNCERYDEARFFALETLSSILNVLSALSDSSQSLPKYRYPSAGSLYPVQTYVSAPEDSIINLAGGFYYHDPINDQLVILSSQCLQNPESSHKNPIDDSSLCTLYFVAALSSIEPLYGSLGNDFCVLEAGYMSHLIQNLCTEKGLASHVVPVVDSDPFLISQLALGEKEKIICRLEIALKKENRAPENLPSLYLYVRENSIESLAEDWYHYNFSNFSFQKIAGSHGLDVSAAYTETYSIFEESACVLFFAMPKNSDSQQRQNALLQSGYFSQSLMEQGVKHQIGTCPIGKLDRHNKTILEGILSQEEVCHVLFAGGVSEEQIKAKGPSKIREGIFETALKEYLKHRLTNYMIPGTILFLENFPLTMNGKVDQRSLKKLLEQLPSKKTERQAARNELEEKLVAIWKEILQIPEVGIHDDFFELGGQSLFMTRLALKVKKCFEIELPLRTFFESTTIASLAEALSQSTPPKSDKQKVYPFEKDTQLDPSIQPPSVHNPYIKNPKAILLTGATGFLGMHLLQELLLSTDAKIYCLIRASNHQQARQRLESSLEKYQIHIPSLMTRIVYVLGDLSMPSLGCSPDVYQELCLSIDAIYHNGAHVHHIYDYKMLRNSNVTSTIEIIKLASFQKEKAIFYVSTLVAANDVDEEGHFAEGFPFHPPHNMISGYQQTKWVSEKLLYEAYKRGIPVMIFRPSTLTGHEETGVCSFENDHFLRLVKGCMQLGYAPFLDEPIDLLPVSFVSRLIVQFSRLKKLDDRVFNITSPYKIRWSDLIQWLNQAGYPIHFLPPEDWKSLLVNVTTDNALFALLPLYLSADVETHSSRPAKNENTLKALTMLHMDFPKITDARLSIYFKYLKEQGFYA